MKKIILILLTVMVFSCNKEMIETTEDIIVGNEFVTYSKGFGCQIYNFNDNNTLSETLYRISEYNGDTIINDKFYTIKKSTYYYGFITNNVGTFIQIFHNPTNKLLEEWLILEIDKKQFTAIKEDKIFYNSKYHEIQF